MRFSYLIELNACLLVLRILAAGILKPASSPYRQMCNIVQLNILEDVSLNEDPILLFKDVLI
jgi:hypothetical protein